MPPAGQAQHTTSTSHAFADRADVWGRDLCFDLMGRLTFTEYFCLLLTGNEPTADQRDLLDVLFLSIAEHGMTPTASLRERLSPLILDRSRERWRRASSAAVP